MCEAEVGGGVWLRLRLWRRRLLLLLLLLLDGYAAGVSCAERRFQRSPTHIRSFGVGEVKVVK